MANTVSFQGEMEMIRTIFAIAIAGLIFAAVSGTSQAAPIAAIPSASSAGTGQLTQVRWYHHSWCWYHPRRCHG
jgi:hypothetical protein